MKNTVKNWGFLLSLLAISFSTLSAQQSLEPFDEVYLKGNIKVYLQEGEDYQVDVDKYDDSKLSITVDRGILKIKRKKLLNYKQYEDEPIRIDITYKRLRGIKATAGTQVRNVGTIKGDQLEVDFGSGAQGKLELDVNDLQAEASEGAQLRLRGRSESVRVKVATGAQFEAFNLDSEYAYVKANTGAQAEVTANKAIEASAHTGGQIDYKGSPDKIDISDNLGGDITRRGR
ncbi:MAG: head GIN domain-containing protein [Bacteroidota bacterium]